MVVDDAEKLYSEYLKSSDSRWIYANSILYKMCEEHPEHDDEHIIVGKIWLIGRSYAAAIERRKNASDSNDDFYYEVVAPKILSIGKELDDRLGTLRKSEGSIEDNISIILSTHKYLMDAFYELTGLEKRSLASKYLHFHCPDKFFIYDSRARAGIGKLVKRPDKKVLVGMDCDSEYGDFVCRMLELQRFLKDRTDVYETPRKLDSFLLTAVK